MSFSIITTVLNGEKFIEHCINSVEKQNYAKNIEHIIVDGGSSDQTLKILKRLSITNKKLKIIEKKILIFIKVLILEFISQKMKL